MIRRTNSHEHGLVRLVAGVAAALAVVRVARDVVRSPTLVRVWVDFAESLDHSIGWHRMPLPLAIATLLGSRVRLREQNLHDTNKVPSVETQRALQGTGKRYLTARSPDGSYNDLQQPAMGSTNSRFGRNAPLDRTFPDVGERLMTPNPRTVSREILGRDTFKPATTLNLLAAAWLQFMVHDWLSHGRNEKDNPIEVPLEQDDDWPERPMRILRTARDTTRPEGADGYAPTFLNTATPWWDASQLYGSGADMLVQLRSGERGKLKVAADGFLPLDDKGIDLTGVNGNYWIGLSLLHNLFALEHNAICDRLATEYPSWSDDDVFDHARLVNAALLAKIHTVEWTPGIIAHPTTVFALRGNWWGLQTEQLWKVMGRLSSSEVISGIPGSATNHFGVPYSITEEFVAVYRMHPLMPDDFSFRSVEDDRSILDTTFPEVAFEKAKPVFDKVGWVNALYSCGTMHPGALTLHNFPRTLQRLTDMEGNVNDLAAIDLMRIRERGVPRYNDFLELLHKPRLTRFEELTDNAEWVEELRRVYNNDIDSVDTMVGLYAEPLPPGFGFSDTAFRIFILMASRRLNSDRFFTVDYNPQVYTQTGMNWINNNNFTSVLLRHAPGLAGALRGVGNAFAPWSKAGTS